MNAVICFDKNLLRSEAFRSLSKWSLLVYFDFLRKRQMEKVKRKKRSAEWVIKNNGDIVYPYLEAEKKGIGRREFRNAIDELIEKGLIDITHQGSGGRSSDMTRFLIDERWKDYGSATFRAASNPRVKDTRKGVGWASFHANKKKTSVTKLSPAGPDSSNKSVTSSSKPHAVSSDKTVKSKLRISEASYCKNEEIIKQEQLPLWSDKIDTIL